MPDQYFAFSYDDSNVDEIVATAEPTLLKVCDACGKNFLPSGRNAWRMRYCQRQHYIKCKICGTPFDCSFEKRIPNTCSKRCGNIYRHQQTKDAMLDKYGVSNASQVPEFKEKAMASNALHKEETMAKIHNTMIDRYGAAIPRQVPELRAKIDATMQKRYGVVNPSHSVEIREKISKRNKSDVVQAKYKATSLAHFGTEYPAQSPDSPNSWVNIRDKFETTMVARYGAKTPFVVPECKEKAKQTCLDKYGYEYVSQSPEIHAKQWYNRENLRAVDGTPLDSTYEILVYDFWKSLGLNVERNVSVDFEYEGKIHTTFIDFRVDDILYEVKGMHLLSGVYDYSGIPISVKLDVYRKHRVVVITNKSDNTVGLFTGENALTGVDIELFRNIPEHIIPIQMWNLIMNQIQNTTGFIDLDHLLSNMI